MPNMPRRENVTYVIYDQFHWCRPDHLVRQVKGWKAALATYAFLKEVYAGTSLGLVTLEYYQHFRGQPRTLEHLTK